MDTPPTEGIGISWGWGFSKTKKFKEMYQVELEFPEGWGKGVLEKIPSVWEVWIFSGTTQYTLLIFFLY